MDLGAVGQKVFGRNSHTWRSNFGVSRMIQPLAGTYNLLRERLKPVETLSLRKRLCLVYLAWILYKKREDQYALVDLAKEFRKLPGRRGSGRTPVEKEARKHFRAVRKHRNLEVSRQAARVCALGQRDRGEGIHSPEELELKKQRWKEVRRKQTQTGNEPNARVWVVTDPEGNEFRVKGLKRWQRENGFSATGDLAATATRPWKVPHHRGYKARHYNEDVDGNVPWAEGYAPKAWNE